MLLYISLRAAIIFVHVFLIGTPEEVEIASVVEITYFFFFFTNLTFGPEKKRNVGEYYQMSMSAKKSRRPIIKLVMWRELATVVHILLKLACDELIMFQVRAFFFFFPACAWTFISIFFLLSVICISLRRDRCITCLIDCVQMSKAFLVGGP